MAAGRSPSRRSRTSAASSTWSACRCSAGRAGARSARGSPPLAPSGGARRVLTPRSLRSAARAARAEIPSRVELLGGERGDELAQPRARLVEDWLAVAHEERVDLHAGERYHALA